MLNSFAVLVSHIAFRVGQWPIALLLPMLLSLTIGHAPVALAQSAPTASDPSIMLSTQEQRELDDLRTEKRFKQFIDDRITNSPKIQDRIELEVDRAFNGTATLLNVVLAILTFIPLLTALGVWLLRRSVVSELVSEVREQLEKEVFTQLKQQKLDTIAEIEQLKQESLSQVEQMVSEAQMVLNELKTQTAIANQEIEQLKSQTASKLETMVSDAQTIKDQTIQELTSILPLSMTDQLPPEAQPRVGNLTAVLESLKKAIPQITFSATDHLKQGNAFFFDSRYDDAVASYDRALQLNPELQEAWFTKASTLMLLQRYDEAASAYQFATQLKPKSYEAWMGLGNALIKSQQAQDAVIALNEAIALKPEDALALMNRANIYRELEQPELALSDYEAAIALKPDFAKAHFQKGQLLRQQGDYEGAIAAYDAVINRNGSDTAEAWYGKALCHALQPNADAALTALETALHNAPGLRAKAKAETSFEAIKSTLRFRSAVEDMELDH